MRPTDQEILQALKPFADAQREYDRSFAADRLASDVYERLADVHDRLLAAQSLVGWYWIRRCPGHNWQAAYTDGKIWLFGNSLVHPFEVGEKLEKPK